MLVRVQSWAPFSKSAKTQALIKIQNSSHPASKPFPLETANEMYKFAFLTKKHQFAKKFPHLTEEELHQKTVTYFVALPKD